MHIILIAVEIIPLHGLEDRNGWDLATRDPILWRQRALTPIYRGRTSSNAHVDGSNGGQQRGFILI